MVAASEVERDASEGGTHFEAGESGSAGGGFAGIENFGAESAAGPVRMNEESADFGGVSGGIEKFIFADRSVVAAEEGFAMAPTAAADDESGAGGVDLGDEVGAVGDELGVDAEKTAESAVDLVGCVIVFCKPRTEDSMSEWSAGMSASVARRRVKIGSDMTRKIVLQNGRKA